MKIYAQKKLTFTENQSNEVNQIRLDFFKHTLNKTYVNYKLRHFKLDIKENEKQKYYPL